MYIEIPFVSLQQACYFSPRLLNLFRNDHVQCYNYLQKCQKGKFTAFQQNLLSHVEK